MSKGTTDPLTAVPGYARFWWASSVSEFGTYFTSVAISALVVIDLHGTAVDTGVVNAARWLPYMLFGLLAGVFVDRVRRRPVLILSDFVRGILLLAVPALALTGHLTVTVLALFMAAFGLFNLTGDAASQSFLPRIVPPALLTRGHAALDQSSAVAQTGGPALGGGLVSLLGAPWTVLVDAVSYLVSGLVLLTIRVEEPPPDRTRRARIRTEVAEGLRWVYRHAMLGPLALTGHAWFFFTGITGAVLAPYVLDTIGLGPFGLGVALSLAGIGSLAGSLVAARLGRRFGTGWTIVGCGAVTPLAYVLMASAQGDVLAWVLLGSGQFVLGLCMGAENSNDMGYRQTVTPDRLQGRMNATIRSINRAMFVISAPLGGLLADAIGYRTALWIVAGGMAAVGLARALSPFRSARIEDHLPTV